MEQSLTMKICFLTLQKCLTGLGAVYIYLVTVYRGLVGWAFRLTFSFFLHPSKSSSIHTFRNLFWISKLSRKITSQCNSWRNIFENKLQAPIVKKYPAKLSLTSFTFFFGLLQFMVIAAFCEKDPVKWKIESGEELFTILYAVSTAHIQLIWFLYLLQTLHINCM